MTFELAAHARWIADDGPLAAMRDAPDAMRSRFGRMLAHILAATHAATDPACPWIVGTTRGPWHARVSMAPDDRAPPWTTPDVVHGLRDANGHRGPATILAAGVCTTAMALVQAAATIATHGRALVLLVEEGTPLATGAPIFDALAVAMRLQAGARFGEPQRHRDPSCSRPTAALAENPLWPALALVQAVQHGARGWWAVQPPAARGDPIWAVELSG